MSHRVFITGFGIITSIGKNAEENFQSLVKGNYGFGPLEVLETVHRNSLSACEVKFADKELYEQAGVDAKQGFTRTSVLGLISLQEAINDAGLTHEEVKTSGLVSATTTGGIREFEKFYYELMDPELQGDFVRFTDTATSGEHCERLADYVGIKKYLGTISTACSSSANALMHGAQLIKNNKLDRVICGGAEALSKFTVNGFNALMILDKDHCRPFDSSRSGLNLGEGACYLVLESEAEVNRKKRKPIAELKGYGNANDAFHQTASSPDGAGAYSAMKLALSSARLNPDEVDYVNAHGTATENNDLSEGLGMKRVFGNTIPYFSSTKPYTGHTLAAAGSVEAAYCLMAIKHQMIWPNLNYKHMMPELGIEPITTLKQKIDLKNVLSNSFGFGGNTSSLLLASV
ncbi:beta-ketoacyl-[acyl-carrier-protein] synthase family protein [Chryseolinea sp. H1M3-3]|uniref:beta-ketoacyl-[acyl-carrier-protein] synthase family protein n=1 Tax=Chryseolinea sp. H1M3-3 TaxID=3034144 RepID=UPI0023ED5D70|nr:beta-ketoacyl-[acyl-carrier-protein] synthase family protein [Chryseolinea sp. H1M3-3]